MELSIPCQGAPLHWSTPHLIHTRPNVFFALLLSKPFPHLILLSLDTWRVPGIRWDRMKIIPILCFSLLACASLFAGEQATLVKPPYDAPAVEGKDQNGAMVKFAEVYKSSPYVVVYFYPKADTPGCTKQGCSLRDAHADLTKEGVKVIGVSHDSVDAEKAFSDKFHFPFTLVADPEGKIIQAFKVNQMKNGMATRQCFIIKEGKVVWHDPKAATDKQADEVKAALASLK